LILVFFKEFMTVIWMSARALGQEFNLKVYDSIESLLDEVDAVDIVTPTTTHYDIASQAIQKAKHCFIEKPVTNTLEEAYLLRALQSKFDVKIQVGHVERYNPAFPVCKPTYKTT
jgi:predicted dehydrogenase